MICSSRLLLVTLMLLLSIPCSAQSDTNTDNHAEQMRIRQAEINRRPDNIGTGKYPALMEEVAGLDKHVVYRPQNLDALGELKLGVVAWGNGGCSADGASSRFHLLEIASHGYLVIANGRILSGPSASAQSLGPQHAKANEKNDASDLSAAIDWALSENDKVGGPYYRRIDSNQIAVSGFSCGGIQAMAIAKDPRLNTIIMHNTGILNDGPSGKPGMIHLEKSTLLDVHTPILYVLGGPTDIAYVNGMDDFNRINHQPAAVANLGQVGHGGSFWEKNGGRAATVAVKWLEWILRGDTNAGKYFLGPECVLCRDSEWAYKSKNLDQLSKNLDSSK